MLFLYGSEQVQSEQLRTVSWLLMIWPQTQCFKVDPETLDVPKPETKNVNILYFWNKSSFKLGYTETVINNEPESYRISVYFGKNKQYIDIEELQLNLLFVISLNCIVQVCHNNMLYMKIAEFGLAPVHERSFGSLLKFLGSCLVAGGLIILPISLRRLNASLGYCASGCLIRISEAMASSAQCEIYL